MNSMVNPAITILTIDMSLMRILSDGPSILEGITNSVADNGGLVGKRTLAAEVALLNHFLGIVPGTTGIGHEDSQRKASSQTTYQQTEHTCHTEDDAYDNRNGNS